MAIPREIPSAARTWGLRQHTTTRRRSKDKDGGTYVANITRQLKGEADPETGEVAERWPVGDFSVRNVLERWGAGRYTVDWFDKAGKRIDGWKFDVAEPQGAPGRAPAARDEGDDDDAAAVAMRLPKTQLEWFIYQQQREERAEVRRRAEAREERDRMRQEDDARAQRDREFIATITTNLAAGHGPAAAAAAAPALDMSRELTLMRREMMLTVREEQALTRAQLLANLPDGSSSGAENFGEALNGAGVAMVEGIGEQMPELVGGLLGKLRAWLKINNQPADAASVAALIEAVRSAALAEAQANGAGGGGGGAS